MFELEDRVSWAERMVYTIVAIYLLQAYLKVHWGDVCAGTAALLTFDIARATTPRSMADGSASRPRCSLPPHVKAEADWKACLIMMGHAGADAAGIILTVDRASFKNFQMAKHAHNLTTGSKRAFSVFLDRAFDSGTALMLPATKTDLNKHQFSYVSACVAEFYFAAAQNATDQTTNSTLPVADALQLCQAGPRA